ncbi:MAG: DUF1735 domain-containing protein [Chitinophaga sp.]|uniref:DUF1735 domain-containing protein n=1 Tax=Chitinophaga sp. TaxID=1869181 RepID=UPI001B0B989F|nr:DUF1735 domain-containing protein [Chitinophaga sp.]MBO9728584.1 DUF1735 domain-containing protein [Chitinophaga sp.]
MKRIYHILSIAFVAAILHGCGKPDYENKEFYKQEVYIISASSTSSTEREISDVAVHTFVDTLKYLNAQYDSDTIIDTKTFNADIKFKVGIGGSLPASRDYRVIVAFDPESLEDFNILKNDNKKIPAPAAYTVNAPFDAKENGFVVTIPKGSSSSSLIFTVPVERDRMKEYQDYAFPLKVVRADSLPLSRQYTQFMIAGLLVTKDKIVNWSGFPIPKIPIGRYYSVQLAGNGGENAPDGRLRKYKFITPLSMADDPQLNGKYMIWGSSAWSFEVHGLHSAGWMYNMLTLVDQNFGLYRQDPILAGNTDFPMATFAYGTVQQSTDENFYDPRLKQLTIHYKNVIGQDYTDVLTYVNEDFTLDVPNYWSAPKSWLEVKSRGYKYWLPQQ